MDYRSVFLSICNQPYPHTIADFTATKEYLVQISPEPISSEPRPDCQNQEPDLIFERHCCMELNLGVVVIAQWTFQISCPPDMSGLHGEEQWHVTWIRPIDFVGSRISKLDLTLLHIIQLLQPIQVSMFNQDARALCCHHINNRVVLGKWLVGTIVVDDVVCKIEEADVNIKLLNVGA